MKTINEAKAGKMNKAAERITQDGIDVDVILYLLRPTK